MYRKIGLVVCIWALAWVMGCAVYADNGNIKVNTANAIEILKPEVGSEGDVILKKDTLYVNLRLSGKSVVYMSLYKIDPDFYLGSQPKADVSFVPSVDFEKLTEEQKMDYRQAVFSKKSKLEIVYNASSAAYYEVLALVKAEHGDVAKMEAQRASGKMTAAQLALSEKYRGAYADFIQNKKEYAAIKALHNKLFTRLVYGPVEVKPTDILLTYQTEIPGVKPGTYVLAFSEKAGGAPFIKTLEFKSETSEKTVEKILDSIPQSMNKLFAAPAQ